MNLSRRATLLGLAGAVTFGRTRLALASMPGQKRLVVVVLRGALDGMAVIVPYGDPHLASLRQPLIPPAVGQPGGMFDLGGFYGLNPAMPGLYAMYQGGELLPVHAVAGPYRTRSHFEAQDLLMLGTETTSLSSGWLNRALQELPSSAGGTPAGLAAGLGVPLILQGPVHVGAYAPEGFAAPPPELLSRIAALNAPDGLLGPAISEGIQADAFDKSVLSDDPAMPGDVPKAGGGFPGLAHSVGLLLAAEGGPRVAAFQLEGYDTHGSQAKGLVHPLTDLDQGLGNLKTALGSAWRDTMVLVVTEFGRTARINGTAGTDHGTATAAYLMGGQVAGGRVVATWPGLSSSQLYQNRDLAPTMDVRSLAKSVVIAQLGLDGPALARVFPDSAAAAPLQGIIRTT